MTIEVKVTSPNKECNIQINLTYDDMSDLIFAIANYNSTTSQENRNYSRAKLKELQVRLKSAAYEIDGE